MADQFHFDPDTYLDMVRSEVPDYEQLQDVVADATGEVARRRDPRARYRHGRDAAPGRDPSPGRADRRHRRERRNARGRARTRPRAPTCASPACRTRYPTARSTSWSPCSRSIISTPARRPTLFRRGRRPPRARRPLRARRRGGPRRSRPTSSPRSTRATTCRAGPTSNCSGCADAQLDATLRWSAPRSRRLRRRPAADTRPRASIPGGWRRGAARGSPRPIEPGRESRGAATLPRRRPRGRSADAHPQRTIRHAPSHEPTHPCPPTPSPSTKRGSRRPHTVKTRPNSILERCNRSRSGSGSGSGSRPGHEAGGRRRPRSKPRRRSRPGPSGEASTGRDRSLGMRIGSGHERDLGGRYSL